MTHMTLCSLHRVLNIFIIKFARIRTPELAMLPTELPCLGLNNNSFSGGYYGAKCKNAKTNILRSANYEFGFEHSLKHCFLNYSFFKDVTLIKGILGSDPALVLILAALAKQAAEMAPKLCWA